MQKFQYHTCQAQTICLFILLYEAVHVILWKNRSTHHYYCHCFSFRFIHIVIQTLFIHKYQYYYNSTLLYPEACDTLRTFRPRSMFVAPFVSVLVQKTFIHISYFLFCPQIYIYVSLLFLLLISLFGVWNMNI